MSFISDTAVWIKFFSDAGMPASDATSYAITFFDNRIRQEMLSDLNKEILRDMGITRMGDIIAILKHAKYVAEQLSCQRVLGQKAENMKSNVESKQSVMPLNPVKLSASLNETQTLSRVSDKNAKSRTLIQYVQKDVPKQVTVDPSPCVKNISKLPNKLSSRLGSVDANITKPKPELSMHGSGKKNSVFERLGDNCVSSTTVEGGPKFTMTMLGKTIGQIHQEKSEQSVVLEGKSHKRSRSFSQEDLNEVEYRSLSVASTLSKKSPASRMLSEHYVRKDPPTPLTSVTGSGLEYKRILKYSSEEIKEISNNQMKELAALRKKKDALTALSSVINDGVNSRSQPSAMAVQKRLGPAAVSSPSAGIFSHLSPVRKVPTTIRNVIKTSAVALPHAQKLTPPASGIGPPQKKMIRRLVKVNRRTGEVVSEVEEPLLPHSSKGNIFSRLGN